MNTSVMKWYSSPWNAVRGGSIYFPCGKQVHRHGSVESPTPRETQPATSLRHGSGGGDVRTKLVFVNKAVIIFYVWLRVDKNVSSHVHVSAMWRAEDVLISLSLYPGREPLRFPSARLKLQCVQYGVHESTTTTTSTPRKSRHWTVYSLAGAGTWHKATDSKPPVRSPACLLQYRLRR